MDDMDAWGCSWEVQKQHGMVYTCQHGPFRPFFHASVAPVGTKAGSSAHPRATSRPRWHPQRWADPFQHPCHPRCRPCPRARRPNPPNPNPRGPVAREQAVAPSHRAVAEPSPSPPSRRCRAAIEPSCEAPACARTRARTHAHKYEESTSRAGGRRSGRHGAGRHGTDGGGTAGGEAGGNEAGTASTDRAAMDRTRRRPDGRRRRRPGLGWRGGCGARSSGGGRAAEGRAHPRARAHTSTRARACGSDQRQEDDEKCRTRRRRGLPRRWRGS